ncbi:pectinesterase/pectinesterase inhibitor PPE8B-like [Nicotiana sylvestris]|uniref:pectinesterase n=1 Tax=Nicotiana sylvestris TaxID=4096 RepID=A0A1U7VY88_NICSY|nr:PREDICTED: probable pectinesterase 56 [Nicotiana sylvestris]XP_009772731.1 PREDICTED: probable pectinesterase 56 [Nicotiana sylvestris]XP_009772732.1 PREDICTED: probable pectinesterase 56 [Nicotiana sylvestris]
MTSGAMWFIAVIAILPLLLCGEGQRVQTPQAIVAKDGSGNYTTITDAIISAPNNSVNKYNIIIKHGTYYEYIQVDKWKTNIVLIGQGMDNTIISGNKSYGGDGIKTSLTATVGVNGKGFMAQDITFRNNAGRENQQAVALRAEADFLTFYRCRFDGFQDTLYTKEGRQFYRDCEIFGTIDFICGDATAVFQNSLIEARLPLPNQYNTITAQHRELFNLTTGIVLQNCTLKATQELEKMGNVTTYLGRPWGNFSRTVVMHSYIDHFINPRGWVEFITESLLQPFYLEYENRGPGAITDGRVEWASVTRDSEIASKFTVRHFIGGDKWIPADVPYYLDLHE